MTLTHIVEWFCGPVRRDRVRRAMQSPARELVPRVRPSSARLSRSPTALNQRCGPVTSLWSTLVGDRQVGSPIGDEDVGVGDVGSVGGAEADEFVNGAVAAMSSPLERAVGHRRPVS